MKQKYQAYANASQTVARTRQIVMLYDGAIRFMQQAREATVEKNIERRYNLLTKTSEIISGLQSCLDFDNGGDMAKLLFRFYSSIGNRIFSIHRSGSADMCDEVIKELKQMRDAWYEIDNNTSRAKESSFVPSAPPRVQEQQQQVILSA